MKTQYFRRPKKLLTPLQGVIVLGALVIVVLAFLIRMFAPGFFATLARPFWETGTSLAGTLARHEEESVLIARIDALTEENETLAQENRTLAARLKDDAEAPDARGILAGVLARPPLSPYDALVVGKGTRDAVFEGMRVFSRGVPVGTVESVSEQTARVALYSTPGRETQGWAGEHRIPITIRGEGGGAFSAEMPKDAGVLEGDTVYMPGPGAVPFGTVVQIESHASSPRSTLRIRPLANPFTMTVVRIVATPAL